MAIGPLRLLAVGSRFRIAGSPCAQQRERCFDSYECMCAAERQPLETCCNAKWKRKEIWSRQNLRIDIGFEEMAALKHSLKIAFARLQRVAKFTMLRGADEVSQPRSAGILVWVTSNMDSALVVSKP